VIKMEWEEWRQEMKRFKSVCNKLSSLSPEKFVNTLLRKITKNIDLAEVDVYKIDSIVDAAIRSEFDKNDITTVTLDDCPLDLILWREKVIFLMKKYITKHVKQECKKELAFSEKTKKENITMDYFLKISPQEYAKKIIHLCNKYNIKLTKYEIKDLIISDISSKLDMPLYHSIPLELNLWIYAVLRSVLESQRNDEIYTIKEINNKIKELIFMSHEKLVKLIKQKLQTYTGRLDSSIAHIIVDSIINDFFELHNIPKNYTSYELRKWESEVAILYVWREIDKIKLDHEKKKLPEIIENCYKWCLKNHLNKLLKRDLRVFLVESDLELSTPLHDVVVFEVNKKLKGN